MLGKERAEMRLLIAGSCKTIGSGIPGCGLG